MKIKFDLGTKQASVRYDVKEIRQEQEPPKAESDQAKPIPSSKLLEKAISPALWRDRDTNVNGF
jgi:hypothetical protein